MGLVVGLVGVFNAAWFSPGDRNATLSTTASMFGPTGLNGFAQAYLDWLGYVLFFVTSGGRGGCVVPAAPHARSCHRCCSASPPP